MAFLDRERNLIVLRVVYDGVAEAGKTTSLRALAGSLGQALHTPAEHDGRTLFFDWMDYTGGRFEGYQIQCQIVSVPGQPELRRRRQHLLKDADVVVHVADSARDKFGQTTKLLADLPAVLGSRDGPPVGVIVQANKRDLPDALPLDEIRARVRAAAGSVGVVESVAADGTGIREAFVFAVRLALDRVREQIRTHTLKVGRPEIDSSAAMLSEMKAAERDTVPSQGLAAPVFLQVLAENNDNARPRPSARTPATRAPWSPDPEAPSGAIWPPVEGRLILHEAATNRGVTERAPDGGWTASLNQGWRAYSTEAAVYSDMEAGREMLIHWARLHVACAGLVSSSRCIVLAATGDRRWRLWQIVRVERSMRDHLQEIAGTNTEEAGRQIVEAAAQVCDLAERSRAARVHVPCSLDNVGRGDQGAIYIGFMPMERDAGPRKQDLGLELESILASAPPARRAELLTRVERLQSRR